MERSRRLDHAGLPEQPLRQAVGSAITAAPQGYQRHQRVQPYNKLQKDLDADIAQAEAVFRLHAADGSDALLGAEAGAGVLALVMAAGVVVGLGRRIAEYS